MDLKNTLPSNKSKKEFERLVEEFRHCPCTKHMEKLLEELGDDLAVIQWCEKYNKRNVKKSKKRMSAYRQLMTRNYVQSIPEKTVNQNCLPKTKDPYSCENKADANAKNSMMSLYPLEFEDGDKVSYLKDLISSSDDGYDADSE